MKMAPHTVVRWFALAVPLVFGCTSAACLAQEGVFATNATADFVLQSAEAADFVFRPSDSADAATVEGEWKPPRPSLTERLYVADYLLRDAGASLVASTLSPHASPASYESLTLVPQDEIDDDWSRVKNVRAAPYKGVAKISSLFLTDGLEFMSGTAFFVSDDVLVTSAHMFRHPYYVDLWAAGVYVQPSGKGRSYVAKTYGVLRNYESNPSVNNDLAWIILDADRPDLGGFKFVPKALVDGLLRDLTLRSAGFPFHQTGMWTDVERYQNVHPQHFIHFHDSEAGCSGMPLFYTLKGKRYAVGVHSGVRYSGISNKATRITPQYRAIIQRVIASN